MPTLRTAIDALLLNFSTDERSVPSSSDYPGRCESCLGAVNGALQEIHAKAAGSFAHETRGFRFGDPETITLSVTVGSRSATIAGAITDPTGCLISYGGIASRVVELTGIPAGAVTVTSVRLNAPWTGVTGTFTATLYRSAAPMGLDALQVADSGPMVTGTSRRLAVGTNERNALTNSEKIRRGVTDFGRLIGFSPRTNRTGTPIACWVMQVFNPSVKTLYAGGTRYLVLSPAPDEAISIEAEITLAPPAMSLDDMDAEIPLPMDWIDSLLLPIATKRLEASPFFRNDSTTEETNRQFNEAMALLKSMRGTRAAGLTMIPAE